MSTLFRWDRGRESSPADMFKAVYDPDDDGSVKSADAVPWTGVTGKPSNYPAEAHNLLSAGHGDTLAASVAAGDLLIGNSTPKWARLAKGSLGQVLRMGASLPEWISDDGWIPRSETWTRLSNTTFRVSSNQTAIFTPGTKIKVTQTSTKYFYVVSSSYSSPNTTVTITGGSDYSLTASPTERWISYVANPQGFPHWFNWTPTITGYSTPPSGGVYRFRINGRTVFCVIREPNNGISNATTLTISVPVAPINITNLLWLYPAAMTDNGASMTTYGRAVVAGTSSEIVFGINPAVPGGFTASEGKRVAACDIWYEI